MTGKWFELRILTGDEVFFEGKAAYLMAPGELGYLGVLANHVPLVTTCVPGTLIYRDTEGAEHKFHAGEGFLEILKNRVTFLTEKISPLEPRHE